MSAAPQASPRQGLPGRISDVLWRNPRLVVFLLQARPAPWLGVIYIGALFALLAQSFSRSTNSRG